MKADIDVQIREIETIYAKLDIRKVRIVLDDAMKLREIYRKDINTFLDSLLC